MEQSRYSLAYRAIEASQVMGWLKAGQSGCIVGLRGVGKSNFLRFLLRPDVQQHYLGSDHTDFIFVFIDLLALAEPTEWAVYELVLDRLLRQLNCVEVEIKAIEAVTSLHREIRHTKGRLIAQRTMEQALDSLCQQPERQIILLFDEFSAVFRSFAPTLFRSLRAIRDTHKGQLSYLVVVSDGLSTLREDLTEVEHFCRLVGRNLCELGPYDESDARQMVRYLAAQRSIELSEDDLAPLIELSGGHAGLLKTLLSLFWNTDRDHNPAEMDAILGDEPAVQAECQKIWNSLSQMEQTGLAALINGKPIEPDSLRRLKHKGLVRQGQAAPLFFSPLFAHFIHRQMPLAIEPVVISRSPRQVRLAGRPVETLTGLEFEMLCYLYEHHGRVCTKDELIAQVYHQQYDHMAGGVSDETLQQLVARLRAKIEPDRRQPRYIVTVRGEGYRFVEPVEDKLF